LTAIQRKLGDQWFLNKGAFAGKGLGASWKLRFGEKPAVRLIRNFRDKKALNSIISDNKMGGDFRFWAIVRLLDSQYSTPNMEN
jgi:hypothetical protein